VQDAAQDRDLVLGLIGADEGEPHRGSCVVEKMAPAFLRMSRSWRKISFSRCSAPLGVQVALVAGAGKGLVHLRRVAAQGALPQADLAGIQAEVALEVGLGPAAALQQAPGFTLELAGVYFLRGQRRGRL
jgi:hypothetical protein